MNEQELKRKRIAVLAPVAWRTPPREYGAWETVASNMTEGLVERGWDVTLFATADSITKARLRAVIERGYEEDSSVEPKVVECLHISEVMEQADEFDLIHNHFDFLPLTYSRLISTPMVTTIHGFSSPKILPVFRKYADTFFISISEADRDPHLPYIRTVYNGIDVSQLTFTPQPGRYLVFLGRIHPDKGTHLAIDVAKKAGIPIKLAGIIQDKDYFEQQVRPRLAQEGVEFIGSVGPEGKNQLFADALAVLHLNQWAEPFGLVMVEAMAAGVPVIGWNLGAVPEVVADGETGFVVNSEAQAVAAVDRLAHIDRRACRERVERLFSINAMVSGYEAAYRAVFERLEADQAAHCD